MYECKVRKPAILLKAGYPVGLAKTSATAGDIVCYGETLEGGGLHEFGRAKVSRARKYLDNLSLLNSLPLFAVNFGGGEPE